MCEELVQAAENILASLAPGREQDLQGCVIFNPFLTSPDSADFLLDLERTQIALGLVVGERNSFFQGKAQHRGLVLLQTSQQVAAFGRLGAPTLRRRLPGLRFCGNGLFEQAVVFSENGRWRRGSAGVFMQAQQELVYPSSPG